MKANNIINQSFEEHYFNKDNMPIINILYRAGLTKEENSEVEEKGYYEALKTIVCKIKERKTTSVETLRSHKDLYEAFAHVLIIIAQTITVRYSKVSASVRNLKSLCLTTKEIACLTVELILTRRNIDFSKWNEANCIAFTQTILANAIIDVNREINSKKYINLQSNNNGSVVSVKYPVSFQEIDPSSEIVEGTCASALDKVSMREHRSFDDQMVIRDGHLLGLILERIKKHPAEQIVLLAYFNDMTSVELAKNFLSHYIQFKSKNDSEMEKRLKEKRAILVEFQAIKTSIEAMYDNVNFSSIKIENLKTNRFMIASEDYKTISKSIREFGFRMRKHLRTNQVEKRLRLSLC